MTSAESKMLTMKIIKLLGIAGIAILAALSWRRVRSAATRKSGAGSTNASRRNVGKVKAARAAPAPQHRAP